MKKVICIIALCGLVGAALLTGCQKEETPSTSMTPSTNAAPAMPSTNTPAH